MILRTFKEIKQRIFETLKKNIERIPILQNIYDVKHNILSILRELTINPISNNNNYLTTT